MVKKLLTRTIIAVLLLSMLLTLAVSCGNEETTTKKPTGSKPIAIGTDDPAGTDDPTTPPESTAPGANVEYPAQLDDIKELLEATTVTFLYVEAQNSGTYTADSIWIDQENAGELDAVDLQVIERNQKIEEDIGVTIEAKTKPNLSISGLQTEAKLYWDIQDAGLDVYCGYQYYDIAAATTGNIRNLNTIVNENNEPIIDITQPYWATNYINSITYNDNLYWVTGDLSLRYTGGLYCTFVNLDLYNTYVASHYGNRTIYDIVDDHEWTMQTMLDMAELAADDDGDGVASASDRLGIVYENDDITDGIAFGCKIRFGKKVKAANGKDEITVEFTNDKNAEKLAGYLNTMYNAIYAYNAGANNSANMMPVFLQGNTLFLFNKIYMSSIWLGEMENLAIIPTPLLDKNQKEYGSGAHDGLTIFGISKYSDCPIASAATLELMAYYGYLLVYPTYVNSVLKGSATVHDDDSVRMVDLIRAGFDSDFVAAWSYKIDNIVHTYRVINNVKNFSSAMKIKSSKWPSLLKNLLVELDEAALMD